MNAPIDRIHAESAQAVSLLRSWFAIAKARAAAWQPAPCPESEREPLPGLPENWYAEHGVRPPTPPSRLDGELFGDDPLVRRAMRRDGFR